MPKRSSRALELFRVDVRRQNVLGRRDSCLQHALYKDPRDDAGAKKGEMLPLNGYVSHDNTSVTFCQHQRIAPNNLIATFAFLLR